jgi:hypothetical protein
MNQPIIRYIKKGDEWRYTGGTFESFAGNFGHNGANCCVYTLFEIDEWDKKFCENVKLKENEKLFRFETDKAKKAGQKPLIKINMEKCLTYFLVQDTELPEFESRGVKMSFFNLPRK